MLWQFSLKQETSLSSVFIGSAWNRARSISVCGALPAHESKDIISIYADTTIDTGEGGERGKGRESEAIERGQGGLLCACPRNTIHLAGRGRPRLQPSCYRSPRTSCTRSGRDRARPTRRQCSRRRTARGATGCGSRLRCSRHGTRHSGGVGVA